MVPAGRETVNTADGRPTTRLRPRLLAVSLALAIVLVGGFVWWQLGGDESSSSDYDAVLRDPSAVVTYPSNGLVNDAVAGDPLPIATLLDQDGDEVSTSELLGEPIVLNLWFTNCAPCATELPEFAEVDAESDVRFVGVNLGDPLDVMEKFAAERGVTYELLRDPVSEFTDAVGAVAFPVTLFVTSDGTIVEQTGVLNADQLRSRIADLLAAEERV